jgi:hypothetical protein
MPLPLKALTEVADMLTISTRFREQLVKGLSVCGINAQTMFADLVGIGEHVAWRYDNRALDGHHAPTFLDEVTTEEAKAVRANRNAAMSHRDC